MYVVCNKVMCVCVCMHVYVSLLLEAVVTEMRKDWRYVRALFNKMLNVGYQ
jgi:hypothetical protein